MAFIEVLVEEASRVGAKAAARALARVTFSYRIGTGSANETEIIEYTNHKKETEVNIPGSLASSGRITRLC